MSNQEHELIVHEGPFETNQTHELSKNTDTLHSSVSRLMAAASMISTGMITDEGVRNQYNAHIKVIADKVLHEVEQGKLTAQQGAEFANKLRDKLFIEYRKFTSAYGVADAEKMKLKARGFDFYLNKYARAQFGRDFSSLNLKEQAAVYYRVIEKAGGANGDVNVKVKKLAIAGKVAVLMTAVIAAAYIAKADNMLREATRQGSLIAGGMLGGYAGGLAVSPLCGPAYPLCVAVVVMVSSAAGALIAESLNEIYQDELEEFQKWLNP